MPIIFIFLQYTRIFLLKQENFAHKESSIYEVERQKHYVIRSSLEHFTRLKPDGTDIIPLYAILTITDMLKRLFSDFRLIQLSDLRQ